MEKKFDVKGNKDAVVNGRIRENVKKYANQECKRRFKKGLSSMLEQFIMNELGITEEKLKHFKPAK